MAFDITPTPPLVPEPPTPAAAKRMTVQDKLYLTAQRQLDSAIVDEDETAAVAALCVLGRFHAASRISTLKENVEWTAGLIEASDATVPCKCGPVSVELTQGKTSFSKEVSNYHEVQTYPQGMLWRCSLCGHQIITDAPTPLAKHQQEMKLSFPRVQEGPDHQVLLNPSGDCSTCPTA